MLISRFFRKKSMSNQKFKTFFLYALGEIILVVVGILIAVQIDSYYNDKLEIKQEKKYYLDIVTDLKKDSIHFSDLNNALKGYLERYYGIYEKMNNPEHEIPPKAFDWMLYNRAFTPITKTNHQATIDNIKNTTVRDKINSYIVSQDQAKDAFDEFNDIVRNSSRPYFFSRNYFLADSVFHENIYGFLPRGSLIDPNKYDEILNDPETMQLLSLLRISGGYALYELKIIQKLNHNLMTLLETEAARE